VHPNVILEEDGENQDDNSEKDEHLQNVQDLIKDSKIQLKRHGQSTADIKTPRNLRIKQDHNGFPGKPVSI